MLANGHGNTVSATSTQGEIYDPTAQPPNVVARMDFSRRPGSGDLVMGSTYRQRLAEVVRPRAAARSPFWESELLAIAIPLAEGLAHVYRKGGLYRP